MTHEHDIGRRHEDRVIDHQFPDATPEERDAHRADLQGFASVVLRISSRVTREEQALTPEKFDSIPECESMNRV